MMYKIFSLFVVIIFCNNSFSNISSIQFHQTEETLAKILDVIYTKQKGAYLRFSDDDVNITHGVNDLLSKDSSYKIIVVAMGVAGRALSARLWKKYDTIFLFDFGSLLDGLCGWETRAWIELTHFDPKTILDLLNSKTHIVSTAALIDNQYESRKKEYIHSIETLKKFNYSPYIVESCSCEPTFLNNYSQEVCYTSSNNPTLRNKGVNEALSLKVGLPTFGFNSSDMIIKLTGRYYFENDSFCKLIENNPDIDVFVKATDAKRTQVFTGCFAMRYCYLDEMLNTLDLDSMEKKMINFETAVAKFITKKAHTNQIKVHYVDHLGVIANIFGKGKCQLTKW